MRTWTNSKGQKIVAEISNATDDTVTLILKKNKKPYELKIADLGEDDQAFIKTWVEEQAEALKKKKDEMFTFGDTKLVPGKNHQLTMKVDKKRYPKASKDTFTMGIVVPKGFDPINKKYTVVQVSVAGTGKPSKALGAYMNLVNKADCIILGMDDATYGSNLPSVVAFTMMNEKWDIKTKQWPLAFFGFSGGAKASAYKMAQAASWDYQNIIGSYMTGCNEDRTAVAMDAYKLKSKQKRIFKNSSIWLSSGTTDKTATPQHHKSVMSSMKKNRIKHVKIHTFTGGHMIFKDDQVQAIQWMRANALAQ